MIGKDENPRRPPGLSENFEMSKAAREKEQGCHEQGRDADATLDIFKVVIQDSESRCFEIKILRVAIRIKGQVWLAISASLH